MYLRGILLQYFIQKKSAVEAHRILAETYGDHAQSDWFRCFKNKDFDVDKEHSGAPKKLWRLVLGASGTYSIIRIWSHKTFEALGMIQ